MKKYQSFLSKNFHFGGEIFYVFEQACFRNVFLGVESVRRNQSPFIFPRGLLQVPWTTGVKLNGILM